MNKISKKGIITLGLLFLLLITYHFVNKIFSIGIPCIFHKITGLYCPGCGITRMIFSMLELNFYKAFRYNPLLFILFWIFVVFEIINIIYYYKNKKFIIISNKIYYVIIAILIIYGILRNIPLFNFLVPIA